MKMFSGIVTEIGKVVVGTDNGEPLTVSAPKSVQQLKVSDSVAVNGACLTVIKKSEDSFSCNVVEETLSKTTLGGLRSGDPVNIELPLSYGDPVGGHLVQGHVDGTAVVSARDARDDGSYLFKFIMTKDIIRYAVLKGYIAIDGVSVTIAELIGDDGVAVSVIPYTYENTIFKFHNTGDSVNVEAEINAKYHERFAV